MLLSFFLLLCLLLLFFCSLFLQRTIFLSFPRSDIPLADPYLIVLLIFINHYLVLVGLFFPVLLDPQQNRLKKVSAEALVDATTDAIARK